MRASILSAPQLCELGALSSAEDAGGKAWSLARLAAEGVAVPPGIALMTHAFDAFVLTNGLDGIESDPGLDPTDMGRFSQSAERIRDRVLRCSLPPAVDAALAAWWAEDPGPWIVRSSAVGEDSKAASFAGQLDSVLDVCSLDGLRSAVLECWASYWSERALFYRKAKRVPLSSMGVVIQRMIEPALGGVLFTQAPDAPGHLRIEWVQGHPQALVDGSVTPESLLLNRGEPAHAEHGELATESLRLEEAYGHPLDLEWVVDGLGKLWFVQARPITTTAPAGRAVVWSNVNVNENYPEPISPLLFSIAREAYEHYFGNIGRAFGFSDELLADVHPHLRHTVGSHGARLYYNLSNIHHCIAASPFGGQLSSAFDGFVGVDDEGKTGGRTQARGGGVQRGWIDKLRTVLSAGRALSRLEPRVARFEARVDAYALDAEELDAASQAELLDLYRRFLDIRFRRWTDASLADVAATLSYAALKGVLRHRLDEEAAESLPPTLLLAIPGVVSAGAVDSLWRLSRIALEEPGLCESLRAGGDWEGLHDELCRGAYPGFYLGFVQHLEDWGFRVSGELMLSVACHQEEPARLLPIIAGFIDVQGPSPAVSTEAQAVRRDAALAQTRRRLGWRWALALGLVLRRAQQSICYRERVRLKQALLYRRLRGVLLQLGERLVDSAVLRSADDIFYLEWQELEAWLSGNLMLPSTVPKIIALRRAAHTEQSSREVPDTVQLPEGRYLRVGEQLPLSGEAGDVLQGVGVSGGQVQATARVMAGLHQRAELKQGEILVARQTDPGWAPLFFLASGLVIERGGMLSHGAIVAREFGIPAVIALPKATEILQTGEVLLVDGDQGRVSRAGGR